jgi:hypothetical protein
MFIQADKQKEVEFQIDLLEMQIAKDEAECRHSIMMKIATMLASTGVRFSMEHSYNLKILAYNNEVLVRKAKRLVEQYGKDLIVFDTSTGASDGDEKDKG